MMNFFFLYIYPTGKAVVLVHEPKKDFYKKFLYEPFPVESALVGCLADHLNAEICSGTVRTAQAALEYLTWTFLYRRVLMNPTYYGLESTDPDSVSEFLSGVVGDNIAALVEAGCVAVDEDANLAPTVFGHLASYYYLSHRTLLLLRESLRADTGLDGLLTLVSEAGEFDELPVRHNEDVLNEQLAKDLGLGRGFDYESPHVKTYLLLRAHLCRRPLPIADYHTDLKSVLDQVFRVLNAVADVACELGFLETTLAAVRLGQCLSQGRMATEDPLGVLPGGIGAGLRKRGVDSVAQVAAMTAEQLRAMIVTLAPTCPVEECVKAASSLPLVHFIWL